MSGEIGIVLEKTTYRPGERIAGHAGWRQDTPPRQASLRLFWRVQGPAIDDVHVVDMHVIARPEAAQETTFEFTLPDEPYSYHGTLFAIEWGVELCVDACSDVVMFTLGAN